MQLRVSKKNRSSEAFPARVVWQQCTYAPPACMTDFGNPGGQMPVQKADAEGKVMSHMTNDIEVDTCPLEQTGTA